MNAIFKKKKSLEYWFYDDNFFKMLYTLKIFPI